ncbi:hypothetical protein BCR44DRAFT_1452901 [Catenaria anguillulae PL171]|uniref:Uncharacterized protein n=1 Tax=Catenaria anguillulae PL171 TaxID=765915 RepID=A0A1Y2H5J9_9FUNG|nr:hypothetical protein BCR44DRAFT_1452901 [Catenaria anguillulae PL171]
MCRPHPHQSCSAPSSGSARWSLPSGLSTWHAGWLHHPARVRTSCRGGRMSGMIPGA